MTFDQDISSAGNLVGAPPLDTVVSGSSSVAVDRNQVAVEQCKTPLISSQRIPFWLIGSLLLLTAAAKAWLLLTDRFADVRVGLSKEILWMAVGLELFLVVANFRWPDRPILACLNTVVFACFAVFAGIRLLLGFQHCGCSGGLEIPGWVFLLIDISIVAWFLARRNGRTDVATGAARIGELWRQTSMDRRGQLAGVGVFAIGLVLLQLPIAAPLRASVLGEPALVARVQIDQHLKVSVPANGVIEVINQSSDRAKVVGLSKSCKCFSFVDDPVGAIIKPNETVTFSIELVPGNFGPLHQRAILFVDHPKQFRVNGDLFSEVRE